MKLEVGMYARTKHKGIVKINEIIDNGVIAYEDDFGREWEEETGRKVIRYIDNDGWNCGLDEKEILKASHNIIDLIEPGDLMYIDISPDDCGGIVVPRVSETLNELEKWKERISSGECILKGVLTKEQINNNCYWVGKE